MDYHPICIGFRVGVGNLLLGDTLTGSDVWLVPLAGWLAGLLAGGLAGCLAAAADSLPAARMPDNQR